MSARTEELKKEWDARSMRMGSTQRAVLSKRFPNWLNQSIHRRHISFVLENCPTDMSRVLDVGCGYGRISRELALHFQSAHFQGVDLCTSFSEEYERTIGPCFNGPIQEFRTNEKFSLILIITTLMYLSLEEQTDVLNKLWLSLEVGGRIVCIEPASEMFILWRRLTGNESASPTGGTVKHFLQHQLNERFAHLDGSTLRACRSVTLFPCVLSSAVHHGVCIEKTSGLAISSSEISEN